MSPNCFDTGQRWSSKPVSISRTVSRIGSRRRAGRQRTFAICFDSTPGFIARPAIGAPPARGNARLVQSVRTRAARETAVISRVTTGTTTRLARSRSAWTSKHSAPRAMRAGTQGNGVLREAGHQCRNGRRAKAATSDGQGLFAEVAGSRSRCGGRTLPARARPGGRTAVPETGRRDDRVTDRQGRGDPSRPLNR
jgi:hypothetical protein